MTYTEYKTHEEKEYSKLWKETGTFFAFGDKQFTEQKQEDVKYYSLGGGMLCPQDNLDVLESGMEAINKARKDYASNEEAREGIIAYELNNHEAYYTGDITDTMQLLKETMHNVTEEEVREVYKKNQDKFQY